jgi:hypothetical protein
MASKGRVYLDCDYGRQRDFTVKNDVRLVYYATSTQSDWPIVVCINNRDGRIHVSVGQEKPNGEMIGLGSFSRDERYDD